MLCLLPPGECKAFEEDFGYFILLGEVPYGVWHR